MTRTRWLPFATLVLVLAIGIACGDDNDHAVDPTLSAHTTLHIIASDELKFTAKTLSVRAGQPVRLVIDNGQNTVLHDWTIEHIAVEDVATDGSDDGGHGGHGADAEYDLHVAVDAGDSGTIEFTPTKPGQYEFICTVTGHAEGGMTGTLTVSE